MGKESSNQQNHQLKTSLHTSAPRNPRPNFTLSSEIGHLRRASLGDAMIAQAKLLPRIAFFSRFL
jgi:hypothetical protein